MHHRGYGQLRACGCGGFVWIDGRVFFHSERGRFPLKNGDRVDTFLTCYNLNDTVWKSICGEVDLYVKACFDNIPNAVGSLSNYLFDIRGEGLYTNKAFDDGYRCLWPAEVHGLGAFVGTHITDDHEIFPLFEDIGWKRAEIKKIKANIKIAKDPTLIRKKKEEIKKIKIDCWPYRHYFRQQRWLRWSYPEIWELKEEIKGLKREGKGNERVEEIEEPKEYVVDRPYYKAIRAYLYPYRLNRERLKLKSIMEYERGEEDEDTREYKEVKGVAERI